MAVKYFCDKCGAQVKDKESLIDIDVHTNHRGRVPYKTTKHEDCDVCVDCEGRFLTLLAEWGVFEAVED